MKKHDKQIEREGLLPDDPDDPFIQNCFEVAKPDLQFKCDWAVYQKNGQGSICYCTDEARANLVAAALNAYAVKSHVDKTNPTIPVFSSTEPSFLGLDSPSNKKVKIFLS